MDPRYRPTTEEVRTAWFQLTQNVESFDAWLAEEERRNYAKGFDAGFGWGTSYDHERIIGLIDAMNEHTTHSELCLKMHWFAEKLKARIEGDAK